MDIQEIISWVFGQGVNIAFGFLFRLFYLRSSMLDRFVIKTNADIKKYKL